jgi:hypothetical protein
VLKWGYIARSPCQDSLQFLLWFEDAVLVDVTASEKAVMHHALAKGKNGDG